MRRRQDTIDSKLILGALAKEAKCNLELGFRVGEYIFRRKAVNSAFPTEYCTVHLAIDGTYVTISSDRSYVFDLNDPKSIDNILNNINNFYWYGSHKPKEVPISERIGEALYCAEL